MKAGLHDRKGRRSEVQEAFGGKGGVCLRGAITVVNQHEEDISGYSTSFSVQQSDSFSFAFHAQYVGRLNSYFERSVE
jgi:hypothetical protein